MAEGTFEYECMRAELLGIDKPNYDEFILKKKEQEQIKFQEEDVDTENIKEVDLEGEAIGRVSGKLDELNNILKKTQTKISQMKASCGSVAGLLKNRLGTFSSQSSIDADVENGEKMSKENSQSQVLSEIASKEEKAVSSETSNLPRKSDLAKTLDKDLKNLDRMIEKAENAEISMAYQTREMKKSMK